MKKVRLDSVSIEITRRCNMKCPHCLCGDAQDIDINKKDIRNLLKCVFEIRILTFTGGEPSLNVKAIRYILKLIKQYNILVEEFVIITNGSKSSIHPDFIKVCQELYEHQMKDACEEYQGHMLFMSNDEYHDKTHQEEVHNVLSQYPFYRKRFTDYAPIRLLKQGRSKTGYEIGEKTIGLDCDYVFGTVFLSATGYILAEPDYSYDNQEKYKLCHSSEFMKYLSTVEVKSLYK